MKVRFVSPWYPDYALVHSGIFVAKQVHAVQVAGHEVVVDVPQIFPAPPGKIPKPVTEATRELASRSFEAMYAQSGDVTYVPTPVPSRGGSMGRAIAMSKSLALLQEVRPDDADVIHAHLGMPTGWAVSKANPDVPLVVTEHQSTLQAVFAEPDAAAAYADVVRNANAFICVSHHLRRDVLDGIGEWAKGRIGIVPNIVDLDHIPFVNRHDRNFSSWIYVGGLMAHKGVQTLLRTFALYLKHYDGEATLTLVGEGPLRRWIEAFAATRGMAHAVRLTGSVEHELLGAHLAVADVMVHLSPAETFGIAPLEGIGAGLPVVALRNWGTIDTWGDIEDIAGLTLPLDVSPAEIASAIADLREAPRRLDGRRARQIVLERYSPGVVAGHLLEVYRRAQQ